MKKFVKIALVLVVVVLAAALVVPVLFKGQIAQVVKREANAALRATLDFEKLDISLLRHFPNASLELKGLTIIGTERFAGDTIVAAKRISVVVDLLSIFGDKGFEVSKVFVLSPALHAHKLADGAVNWDIVKPSNTIDTTVVATADDSQFKFSLRDFRISDASLRYEDDSTSVHFTTTPASLRLRGDLSAEATSLDLRLSAQQMRLLSGGVPLLSDTEAELNAVIAADLKNNRFTFSQNKLRLNAIQLVLDGWVELQDTCLLVDLKAGCDKVQFKDVLSLIPAFYTRDFKRLAAGGELSMALWTRGRAQGQMIPAFELKTEVRDGSFQYSSLPKAVNHINIAARISNPGGVMDKTEIDLSKFDLDMAGNPFSATLFATNLISDPIYRASLKGRLDLETLKEVYPFEKGVDLRGQLSADVKLSGRISDVEQKRYEQIGAAGTFVIEGLDFRVPQLPAVHIRRAAATITPAAMTLGELGVTVGGSDLSANGQLTGYIGYLLRGDMLSGRLYVKSDLLDLNEIRQSTPAADSAVAADTTAVKSVRVINVPHNMNLTLVTELHKVLFQKMTLTDVTGQMRVADGALLLERLGMQLFGGRAMASGSYSTAINPQRPVLKLSLDMAGASFEKTFQQLELVQKLVPIFAKTGGDYALSLNLSTALDVQMSPEFQTLDATGEIRSANIQVQNIAAFDALAKALHNDALRRIEAKDVAIRFSIREGRVYTQPFDLKMGNIRINLAGSTGLDQTINYVAKVALPTTVTGGVLQSVDVGIGGTFAAPKISLDMQKAAEEAVKNVIDQQIQKFTGSKTLSDEVQKQAVRLRDEAAKAGQRLVSAAEEQGAKIVEAAAAKGQLAKYGAQKGADKMVAEAQRQAAKLQAEAEIQIEKLTTKSE
ncbi:MAG: AsmA-like C-terminal region-containing protein [Alistipes sp.]